MNGQRVIAAEFAISLSILTWGATRQGFWPWPASIARAAFAFAVLSLLGLISEEFAALLGAGFLLAQVLKTPVDANGNFKFTGGIPDPKDTAYPLLDIAAQKTKRPEQKWTPGASSPNRAMPADQQKPTNGNGGVVNV